MFENMTSREKTLSMIVAALLPIGLLFFGFTWFMNRYESNLSDIDDLEAKVEAQETIQKQGTAASTRQRYYRKVSFPNANRTRNIYKTWLDNLVLKEAGMSYTNFQMRGQGSLNYQRDRVATRSEFKFRPKGTYQQLVKFLHGFYSAEHLHRIKRLSIKPESSKKGGKAPVLTGQLNCEIEIETLSLVDGPARLASFPAWKKELSTVDKYSEQILARNIFGPANNTPTMNKPRNLTFKIPRPKDGEVAKEVSGFETIKLSAKDADADDVLAFEMLEKSGEDRDFGIKLSEQPRSEKQRQISLKVPKQAKPIKIPVSMRVYDSGLPAKEDKIDFMIVFEMEKKKEKKDAPPPKPIVYAEVTVIRGLTRSSERRWAAILYNELTGEKHTLALGDSLEVDKSNWKVVAIDRDTVTFEVDGKRKSFETDDNLAEPMTAL